MNKNWSERSQYPFLATLEADAQMFRQEVLAVSDDAFRALPDETRYSGGAWSLLPLLLEQYGEDFPDVSMARCRALCPGTWRALQKYSNLIVAGFMRLEAGGVVVPHRDVRDNNVLRVHVGLQLPPDEQVYWPEGTARLMDIRVLHEAKNPSKRSRISLCCDFRMPYEIPTGVLPSWGPPGSEALGEITVITKP